MKGSTRRRLKIAESAGELKWREKGKRKGGTYSISYHECVLCFRSLTDEDLGSYGARKEQQELHLFLR